MECQHIPQTCHRIMKKTGYTSRAHFRVTELRTPQGRVVYMGFSCEHDTLHQIKNDLATVHVFSRTTSTVIPLEGLLFRLSLILVAFS